MSKVKYIIKNGSIKREYNSKIAIYHPVMLSLIGLIDSLSTKTLVKLFTVVLNLTVTLSSTSGVTYSS